MFVFNVHTYILDIFLKKDAASPDGGAIAGTVIGVVIFIVVVAVVVVLVLLIVTRQLNRKKQFDRIQMDIFAM